MGARVQGLRLPQREQGDDEGVPLARPHLERLVVQDIRFRNKGSMYMVPEQGLDVYGSGTRAHLFGFLLAGHLE